MLGRLWEPPPSLAGTSRRSVGVSSTWQGRLGSSLTGQMTEALKGEGGRLEVRWAHPRELRWLLTLLGLNIWNVVNLASRRPSATLITDASWGPDAASSAPIARLCWWVFAPGHPPFGEATSIPECFLQTCAHCDTQIMIAELLAALIPIVKFPPSFVAVL